MNAISIDLARCCHWMSMRSQYLDVSHATTCGYSFVFWLYRVIAANRQHILPLGRVQQESEQQWP